MNREDKMKCYFRIDENTNGDAVVGRYPVVKAELYGDYVVHTSPGQTKVAPSSQMSCVKKKHSGHFAGGFAPTIYEAWEKYEETTDKKWERLRKEMALTSANCDMARRCMRNLQPSETDGSAK